MVVVLPAPFGPTSPTISPGATWKLTSSTAFSSPKDLHRCWAERTGAVILSCSSRRPAAAQIPAAVLARPRAARYAGGHERPGPAVRLHALRQVRRRRALQPGDQRRGGLRPRRPWPDDGRPRPARRERRRLSAADGEGRRAVRRRSGLRRHAGRRLLVRQPPGARRADRARRRGAGGDADLRAADLAARLPAGERAHVRAPAAGGLAARSGPHRRGDHAGDARRRADRPAQPVERQGGRCGDRPGRGGRGSRRRDGVRRRGLP